MRFPLFQSQKLILTSILSVGLLPFSTFACAQDADAPQIDAESLSTLPPPDYVVPPPRTITADLPQKNPEKVVDIFWHDDENHVCVDTFKLSLSRSTIIRNTTVSARVRISRKCDDRTKNAPAPLAATMTTRSGQKSGPSETLNQPGVAFAYSLAFPTAGAWQLTVVVKYENNENYTVTVPVHVLAEPPVAVQNEE